MKNTSIHSYTHSLFPSDTKHYEEIFLFELVFINDSGSKGIAL